MAGFPTRQSGRLSWSTRSPGPPKPSVLLCASLYRFDSYFRNMGLCTTKALPQMEPALTAGLEALCQNQVVCDVMLTWCIFLNVFVFSQLHSKPGASTVGEETGS